MLLLEPAFGEIHWSIANQDRIRQGKVAAEPKKPLSLDIMHLINDADVIGYILANGADIFRQLKHRLEINDLSRLENNMKYAPDLNRLTHDLVRYGLTHRPDIPQYLLCETAFFSNIPACASAYALPYKLFEKGIRRYGGDGLCHHWIWKSIHQYDSGVSRLLSIHLCNTPNLAAIKDGAPIETSLGFSTLEGLPSATGCGDIDPSIILQFIANQTPTEIEHLLAHESGWKALAGKSCSFNDLLTGKEKNIASTREMFRQGLLKTIGAGFASLGGADAIVFAGDVLNLSSPFIINTCHALKFAGVICSPEVTKNQNGIWNFTAADSQVKIFGVEYHRIEALHELLN
jgi:acetate kinase